MGAVVPFIPTIAGAIGGLFGGKKATSSAEAPTANEQTAITGAQTAGAGLNRTGAATTAAGSNLLTGGAETLKQPLSYYQRLLSGNRALASQAVAAPTAQLTDVYRGAARGLERSGVRGAARDQATADLNRDRASKIASLITGVQPGAAGALTGIGQTQTAQGIGATEAGTGAYGAAGNLYNQQNDLGFQNRVYGRQQGQDTGSSIGKFLFGALKGFGGGGGGGLSKLLPALPVTQGLGGLNLPSVSLPPL